MKSYNKACFFSWFQGNAKYIKGSETWKKIKQFFIFFFGAWAYLFGLDVGWIASIADVSMLLIKNNFVSLYNGATQRSCSNRNDKRNQSRLGIGTCLNLILFDLLPSLSYPFFQKIFQCYISIFTAVMLWYTWLWSFLYSMGRR